jgi:hypothetical protein
MSATSQSRRARSIVMRIPLFKVEEVDNCCVELVIVSDFFEGG